MGRQGAEEADQDTQPVSQGLIHLTRHRSLFVQHSKFSCLNSGRLDNGAHLPLDHDEAEFSSCRDKAPFYGRRAWEPALKTKVRFPVEART
jgi:hypothetical protein